MAALEDIGGRLMRKLSFGFIAGLLALAALGVALSAFYLWLLAAMTPPAALGIVAGILFFVAILTWGLAIRRPSPALSFEPADSITPGLAVAVPATADMVRRAVAADPKAAMLGALAAGYVLDSSPGLDAAMLNRIISQMQR